jgi:glycerophosphoryl diester phosphodiesterase
MEEKSNRAPQSNSHFSHKIIAVGHRGTKKFAPENTISAHEAALALGARAVEFDVRFTKDGHAVVIHDATVNRTTDGRGCVKNMTLGEIKALDAGSWKEQKFTGEKIPTLREALRNIKERAVVDIDFKGGPTNSGERLLHILDEEGFRNGSLVTIFARPRHVKRLEPLAPHYALRPHFQSAAKTRAIAERLGIKIMGLRRRSFSHPRAASITSRGLVLFTNIMGWADGRRGIDDSIKAGARFIQTDNLDVLVPYLRARGLLETRILNADFTYRQSADDMPAMHKSETIEHTQPSQHAARSTCMT